jgi:hypothetical protein
MTSTPERVQGVIADDTTSEWLRTALQSALQRDPVDSLNDALLLAGLLEERLRLLFDLSGLQEASSEED